MYDNIEPGTIFTNWTVLSYVGKINYHSSYLCRCKCGTERIVEGRRLFVGKSKSCGCFYRKTSEEKRLAKKKYKAEYFQKNKKRIYERVLKYQDTLRKEQRKLYGIGIYDIKSKYGIEPDDFVKLLGQQKRKCAICGKELLGETIKDKPYVDHNHQTGVVRGILCMNCNSALGHFHDDISVLKNAIKYLERYENEVK